MGEGGFWPTGELKFKIWMGGLRLGEGERMSRVSVCISVHVSSVREPVCLSPSVSSEQVHICFSLSVTE